MEILAFLLCARMGFLGSFNLFVESCGQSACYDVLYRSKFPSWRGRPWLCARCDEVVMLPLEAELGLSCICSQTLRRLVLCPLLLLFASRAESQSALCTCVWQSLQSLVVIVDFWTESMSSSAVILIRLFSRVCGTLCCYCCSDLSLIRKPVYLTAASCSKGFVLLPLTELCNFPFTVLSLYTYFAA